MDPMTDENSATSVPAPTPPTEAPLGPMPEVEPNAEEGMAESPTPAPAPVPEPTPSPAPSVGPAPRPTAPVFTPPNQTEESGEIVEFSDKEPFNWALLLCWVACFIAVASAGYFYLIKRSSEAKLISDKSQLDQVNGQIQSSSYVNAERNARAFKSAVAELVSAKANRYLMSEFLPAFYKRIGKNIIINNITITSDAKLSLDGSTDSYRSVSDQMLSFKSWQINDKTVLAGTDLTSVSEKIVDGKPSVSFVMTMTLADKTIDFTGTATATDTTTEGGTNAEVQ